MSLDNHITALRSFYGDHNRMPSYTEMLGLFGFASKNAVFKVVKKLIDAGFISKDGRTIVPTDLLTGIRVLGDVQAGFPTPSEESLIDTMNLDQWLIGNREATYMLTVSGDSMRDAGILEGDVVLVERTNNPRVGQIAIAEVDGNWTMKYLRKKSGKYYLEAANNTYPDMYPLGDLKIEAVVTAVVRKLE